MSKNKILFTFSNELEIGETTLFFDDKKIITNIDGNDGHYRHEYMNVLFENFGIDVVSLSDISELNSDQKKTYLKYLKDSGLTLYKEPKQANEKKHDFFSVLFPSPYGCQDVLFYIDKEMKSSQNFLNLYSKFMKMGQHKKHQHITLSNLSLYYHFKKDTLKETRAGNGNYMTNKKQMSDRSLVKEIVDPKKINPKWSKLSDIKTIDDFYEYINEAKCFNIETL